MDFTYDINGRKFEQRKLVLGQVKQLFEAIQGMRVPMSTNVAAIIASFGDRMPRIMAIVLIDQGKKVSEKDVDEVQSYLEEYLDIEDTLKIVSDFFDCNPIASISEAIVGLAKKMNQTKEEQSQILSTSSASLSPEEILPNET